METDLKWMRQDFFCPRLSTWRTQELIFFLGEIPFSLLTPEPKPVMLPLRPERLVELLSGGNS